MSTLVVLLPPRLRPSGGEARADVSGDDLTFVLTSDGSTISKNGRAPLGLLPRAESIVVVVADTDVSWLRLDVPRAPAARLRAALAGVVEERLLDDPEAVHLALEPGAAAGQDAWVCAVNKGWLQGELARFDQAGLSVERVVPMSWPEDTPLGHFCEAAPSAGAARDGSSMQLIWSDANGVTAVPLRGSLARAMMPQWGTVPARWSANPAVAAQAERWLGARVFVLRDEERALQAMRSLWNLRQFDLVPSHRGTLALREGWKRFMSLSWRPVRVGLVAFAVLNVVGLNLWAWHLRNTAQARSVAMTQVLKDTHPQVRSIYDAPAQMLRETEGLRATAGRLSDSDLETVLSAIAAAWPDGRAPVDNLSFESGRLSVSASGWSEAQITQFRHALRPAGWLVENVSGVLTVSRTPGTAKAS